MMMSCWRILSGDSSVTFNNDHETRTLTLLHTCHQDQESVEYIHYHLLEYLCEQSLCTTMTKIILMINVPHVPGCDMADTEWTLVSSEDHSERQECQPGTEQTLWKLEPSDTVPLLECLSCTSQWSCDHTSCTTSPPSRAHISCYRWGRTCLCRQTTVSAEDLWQSTSWSESSQLCSGRVDFWIEVSKPEVESWKLKMLMIQLYLMKIDLLLPHQLILLGSEPSVDEEWGPALGRSLGNLAPEEALVTLLQNISSADQLVPGNISMNSPPPGCLVLFSWFITFQKLSSLKANACKKFYLFHLCVSHKCVPHVVVFHCKHSTIQTF